MIRFNEVDFGAGQPVDAYGPGYFRLGDVIHQGPMALFPGGAVPWTGTDDLAGLLEPAKRVDVILVGTGDDHLPLDPDAKGKIEAEGTGVETMATPAACRTYNVLLAEGRRVALAVMPMT